ncbi:MAG: dockerin type I repeat-containing protein [Ruminococcus sp.]|nr:dockerin type I repeat-containing protein [Ruminococcus sp.]
MRKIFRKISATVSAVVMCALTTVNFSVYAVETGSPLDRIIKSYEEPYVTYEIYDFPRSQEIFIAQENEYHLLHQYVNLYVDIKDGQPVPEIPVENVHINETLTGYTVMYNNYADENKIIGFLSECEDVLSVDKVYTVHGDPDGIMLGGAWVKYSEENKDILSEYQLIDTADDKKYIFFKSQAERFEFMKKMHDNNIEYELQIVSTTEEPPVIAEEKINLYTSPDNIGSLQPTLLGDANEDGELSLSDAVLIMQSLSNPDTFQLTPQGKANADIYGDGDGVTAMDALQIQKIMIGLA